MKIDLILFLLGAWACALGFPMYGVPLFTFGSLAAIIVNEDTSGFTLMFCLANVVALLRVL
jgi:hypothetical protein